MADGLGRRRVSRSTMIPFDCLLVMVMGLSAAAASTAAPPTVVLVMLVFGVEVTVYIAVGAVEIVITDGLGAMVVLMKSGEFEECTILSTGTSCGGFTLLRRIEGVVSCIFCQSVGKAQACGLFE